MAKLAFAVALLPVVGGIVLLVVETVYWSGRVVCEMATRMI